MYKNCLNLGLCKAKNNKSKKKTTKPVDFSGAMDLEASSSHHASSPPPTSTPFASTDTSKYLSNLPSRGLFSSPVITTNPGSLRVYICDHDTAPPEDQQIKTNPTNILIRSLVKKQKSESSSKDVKDGGARKRGAEKALEGRPKRAITDGSSTASPAKNLNGLTVERLRALLKEKGLSPRGKKEELIARLKNG